MNYRLKMTRLLGYAQHKGVLQGRPYKASYGAMPILA